MTGFDQRACPTCGSHLRTAALFCPECGTAVMPAVNNALRVSLQQIMATMKPGQVEVLRRCAIPRWFDRAVLAILRDRDDDEANAHILEQLARYSFVREVAPGRYAYASDVRELLREDWRERLPELRTIVQRLYTYFEQGSATSDEQRATWLRELVSYDLLLAATAPAGSGQPGPVWPGLTPDLPAPDQPQILPTKAPPPIDEENSADILKGASDLRQPQPALLRFRSLMDSALRNHRLAEADGMLQAAEEQTSILDRATLPWLRYYRASLHYALLNFKAARAGYEELIGLPHVEDELRGLALLRLGDVQVETSAWSAAIRTYRTVLELPELSSDQRAAAHLGLADAYNELVISSGGWYIPSQLHRGIVRLGWQIVYYLTLLPMLVLVTMLRRLGAAMPTTDILWRYQNWFLARIFRAARENVQAAAALYAERDDQENLARCRMRLVESDLHFGEPARALRHAEELLQSQQAADPYRQARYKVILAQALMAQQQLERAQALAGEALQVFELLDDVRWLARTLTLRGRICALQGQNEQALTAYKRALELARVNGSVLNRERTLYELRSWRRLRDDYPREINALLEREPVQRFVARLPQFLLPGLRAMQVAMVPGALLIAAILTPRAHFSPSLVVDSVVLPGARTFTFPIAGVFAALVIMWLAGSIVYALLALLILWRMPLSQLQRNQPEMIELHPDYLVEFDAQGEPGPPIALSDVGQVVSIDRQFWTRSLSMFSYTVFELPGRRAVYVDGIMSWYSSLVAAITRRAREAGAALRLVNPEAAVLRRACEISTLVGLLALSWLMAAGNGWLPDPARSLPPTLFALLQLTCFSGVLLILPLIYWIVQRPLWLMQRFNLADRWHVRWTVFGFAIVLFVLYLNGAVVRVPIFRVTLFVTSVYLVSEMALLWLAQRWAAWRRWSVARSAQALVMLISVLLVWQAVRSEFYNARSYAYAMQGNADAAFTERTKSVEGGDALFTTELTSQQGAVQSIDNNWQAAEQLYREAIDRPESQMDQGLAYHNLAVSQLERCKHTVGPTCPELSEVIANEQRALTLIDDPNARTQIYITLADAYQRNGQNTEAVQALEEARKIADPKRYPELDRLLESLRR